MTTNIMAIKMFEVPELSTMKSNEYGDDFQSGLKKPFGFAFWLLRKPEGNVF